MRSNQIRVLIIGVAAVTIGIYAEKAFSTETKSDPLNVAVDKGVKWLVSVQGKDGGWGQDGGETSYVRQGERLESNGNDVANTAVAAEALLHTGTTPASGEYRQSLQRAVSFILDRVEQSPVEGLAVTSLSGTQIQRKLGPYIDTFLTAKLLGELDGNMGDARANARVRQALEKCVAKIEKSQLQDGSWNISGGWAPIVGTSMASQSLYIAQSKGVPVQEMAMAKIEDYTQRTTASPPPAGVGAGTGGGLPLSGRSYTPLGSTAETVTVEASAKAVSTSAAGVSLYKRAQELEQLSRTDADRKKNAAKIGEIRSQLANARFVTGFGSIGGEEFFSWLNISDSLRRTGGPEWEKWNADMKSRILNMQNDDGTWAGHHCITGRVAVTSAAVLMLRADHDAVAPAPLSGKISGKK
jgi:hypothetical protein